MSQHVQLMGPPCRNPSVASLQTRPKEQCLHHRNGQILVTGFKVVIIAAVAPFPKAYSTSASLPQEFLPLSL